MNLICKRFHSRPDQVRFSRASCKPQDSSSCVLIPVRRAKPCKSWHNVNAICIRHRQAVFFRFGSFFQKLQLVTKPLNSCSAHENASLKSVSRSSVRIYGNGSQKSLLRLYRPVPSVHQEKSACSICIFYISRLEAALPEKRSLLVACCPGNWDSASDKAGTCISVNAAAGFYLGKHIFRNPKIRKNFLIPLLFMNVEQHSSGSVCIICHMDSAFCELPDQPGIYCSKQKITFFCCLFRTVHIFKNPPDLCSGKISVRNQTCFLSNNISKPIFFQFFYHPCCSAALPHNCRIDRISCFFIPHNGCFSLVCNTDCFNILRVRADETHSLNSNPHLGGPDFMRIVFHPARFRIILGKFLSCHTAHFPRFVKKNAPGTCRSLIQSHNIFPHNNTFLYLPLLHTALFSFSCDYARKFFPTKYPRTSTPRMIRYQPNALKSCFFM